MLVRTSVVTVYDLSDVRIVFVSCLSVVRFRFRDDCACVCVLCCDCDSC